MNVLLAILGLAAALAFTILKGLALDEVRGRIQRRISASVEATLASLPPELAAEWTDEWRAELAAVISMPVAAARLARGLRHSASQLIGEPPFAPAEARAGPPQRSALKHVPQSIRSAWRRREQEGTRHSALARDRLALLSSSSTALSWRSPTSPTSPPPAPPAPPAPR